MKAEAGSVGAGRVYYPVQSSRLEGLQVGVIVKLICVVITSQHKDEAKQSSENVIVYRVLLLDCGIPWHFSNHLSFLTN